MSYIGGADPDQSLAQFMAEAAREMTTQPSVRETMDLVVAIAADLTDAEFASVSTISNRTFKAVSSTDQRAVDLDALQEKADEGPCLDALREHEVYRTGDLGADPRWSRFGPLAVEAGVRSMLAHRLWAAGDSIGVLNMFHSSTDAFSDQHESRLRTLATHAGIVIEMERAQIKAEHLEIALTSNRRIGMAMGIIMRGHRLDEEQAWQLLRKASQDKNVKAHQLADDIIRSGQLPNA